MFRPLNVSDLIDETFRIFRRHFLLFVKIGAVLMIPIGLIEIIQQVAVQQHADDLEFNLLTSGLVTLVRAIVYLAVLSAIIYAMSEIRMGRVPTVSEAYNEGMAHYLPMLWIGLIYWFILLLLTITILGFPFAVYLSICWLFGMHVAVIEGKRGMAALSRSKALVKGHWWRVIGISILVSIIVGIISVIFSAPSTILGVMIAFGRDGETFRAIGAAIGVIFSTAGTIITGPIIYIASVLLYYDLRARKEGLDLEMMASQTEAVARSAYPQM
ncbi:MAG TPA: glycerophosphoryl diester phosphodiesterase membrane domain-containing protein [Nitrolancea sp.]|nr:glycerophosphoryl diester phosphodiesterase membrane domain-containing protein [Nitrolancea sp.]